ncbi:MAG: hypothetical protein B6U86_03395 [Candidatus Altiarchaeales archaeon ex4484_43]|nr:MAG: hypothetical protein B6U86_03395 [Candidatus Altiarchaeales archaeon ex4484_43]
MSGLRVCMLIDVWTPVYGGGKAHVWELSKNLVERHNCVVDIYTRKLLDDSGVVYDKDESYFNGRLNVYRVGYAAKYSSLMGRFLYALLTPFRLKKRYDLIHAHAYYAAYPAKIIQFLTKKPLIFTVHGVALEARGEMDSGITSSLKSFMENATLFKLRYDCEISVDSSIRDYKNVNKKIEVIPNGVDVAKFDEVITEKTDKFKILYVGRLHPQKGLKYLIKAAEKVIEKNPGVEFHLIGSGPLEQELRSEVRETGLSRYFRFRGKIFNNQLIKEYKSSRLFVLPSIYEGQPLTLLEAWAAKLPVVATDVGGNKDFIREGVNGYLVEPRNPGKLAEAIIKAIGNKKLDEIGLNGYALVKESYTWVDVAEKTYKLYLEEKK